MSVLERKYTEMVMGDEPGDTGLAGEKIFPAHQSLSAIQRLFETHYLFSLIFHML